MTDPAQLLEAHVAFEVARWSGERLDETVAEHAGAVRRWLDGVTVAEVAPAEATAGTLGRVVAGLDLSDALVETVADDRSVRDAVIAAVTASKGYRKLVSHVLYQGVKGYVLTENVVARKLPGASTLVKFGQKTMSAAAPNLEAGVDRRLTAFVEANLSETLRESRRYLEATLTPDLLAEMADEVWTTLADRPVGEILAVADPEGTREVVVAVGPVVRRWQDEGVIAEVVESVALEALEEHADRSVGELLEEWGLAVETVVADVLEILRPGLEHARTSGLLEERVRAHLEPFYVSLPSILEAVPAAKPSRKRTTRRTKHES